MTYAQNLSDYRRAADNTAPVNVTIITAEHILAPLAKEARNGIEKIYPEIERLQAPVYVTDPNGVVTFFNSACTAFTGRMPEVGKDLWCVTWKLYAIDGTPLPHDACPMAQAIKQSKPIRGAYADAERPDGTKVRFTPFPTPLYDQFGNLIGAVNILLDVSDSRQIDELRISADRCRRLSRSVTDEEVAVALRGLAAEYEGTALDLITVNKRR
jgi:PAS domain-containing protein